MTVMKSELESNRRAPFRPSGNIACPRRQLSPSSWRCRMAMLARVRALAQLRLFEHFRAPKWLRLLRPTPEGRHYNGVGGTGPAVIWGGGSAGSHSLGFRRN